MLVDTQIASKPFHHIIYKKSDEAWQFPFDRTLAHTENLESWYQLCWHWEHWKLSSYPVPLTATTLALWQLFFFKPRLITMPT